MFHSVTKIVELVVRHRLIWKNSAPFAEGLICRDEQRALCTKTPGTTAALVS
jgi:hypothetical protein